MYENKSAITLKDYLKNPEGYSVKNIKYLGNIVTGEISSDSIQLAEFLDFHSKEIKGTDGNDILRGSHINDIITGGTGNDKLYGGKGKNVFVFNEGNDYIDGGNGNDILKGGNGNDIIYGGSGDNKLYGEGGDNKFIFNSDSYDSHDIVYMGKGHDTFVIDTSLNNIHYEKSGNHLVIKYGDGASITVNNYFSSKYKSVDIIKNLDETESVSLKEDIIIGKKYENSLFYNGKSYNISNAKYDGNEYNNLIVANDNKKLNDVDAGQGDDVIYCQGKSVIADGGCGDDTYVISSLKNATLISDIHGDDTVKIVDKSSNINLIFNVATNSGDLNEYEGMYILNNATLSRFIKSRNIDSITSGIEIAKFFNSDGVLDNGAIERIESTNGHITKTQINEVKESVVSWLTANNYDSAYEAFAEADKSTLNELVAIYQNIDWQNL